VAKNVVTPERFASGMTFDHYLAYIGTPENLAREAFGYYGGSFGAAPRKDNSTVIRERYARARLAANQREAITWLAAQPAGGPARILVISEDWSSDCRRDVPMLARLAEAGKLELRIFNRDGAKILGTGQPDPATGGAGANHDLMLEFMNAKNGGEWASVPVAVVYTKDFRELYRYIEYPAIYVKDRIRGHQQAVRPGESGEQARERGMREFAVMQASPFFDLWASASVDEILSGIYEKLTVGSPA
jgi:hypothetical protein